MTVLNSSTVINYDIVLNYYTLLNHDKVLKSYTKCIYSIS